MGELGTYGLRSMVFLEQLVQQRRKTQKQIQILLYHLIFVHLLAIHQAKKPCLLIKRKSYE